MLGVKWFNYNRNSRAYLTRKEIGDEKLRSDKRANQYLVARLCNCRTEIEKPVVPDTPQAPNEVFHRWKTEEPRQKREIHNEIANEVRYKEVNSYQRNRVVFQIWNLSDACRHRQSENEKDAHNVRNQYPGRKRSPLPSSPQQTL